MEESKIFKVNVYTIYNPKKPDENVIGTVEASYVSDGNGGYLKDQNGNLYVAPVGYSPYEAYIYGAKNPFNLLDYRTGGPRDLQRSFQGKSFGGFVPAFTSIASFDVCIAYAGAIGVTKNACLMGGGIINLRNSWDNNKIDTSGEYGNNPKNVPNIRSGYDWARQNMFSFGDMVALDFIKMKYTQYILL